MKKRKLCLFSLLTTFLLNSCGFDIYFDENGIVLKEKESELSTSNIESSSSSEESFSISQSSDEEESSSTIKDTTTIEESSTIDDSPAINESSSSSNEESSSIEESSSSNEESSSIEESSTSIDESSTIEESNSSIDESSSVEEEGLIIDEKVYGDFQIYFMELGNAYTGDSTYIKAGDTDILIDAGSQANSAVTIEKFVNKYCTDGILEYVITTHGDSDHITGMFGNSKSTKNFKGESISRTGIMYYYEIETLIDFSITIKSTQNMSDYQSAVTYAENKGTTHYKAGDCFNNANGASSHYVLDKDNNITMDILYNKFYYEKSSDENNHSVCTLFTYGNHHFLLTGDLEEKGEEALASYYDGSTSEKTLPHCDLFKAGHHGSKTSSNECLLSKITPDICCVCCCAGGSEYTNFNDNTFPTQEFIDRIAKYTDRVYVTSKINETRSREEDSNIYESFNGTICVSSNGKNIGLDASNNLTKLKDSEWFNETVYLIDGKICSAFKKRDFYTKTTAGVVATPRRTWPSK